MRIRRGLEGLAWMMEPGDGASKSSESSVCHVRTSVQKLRLYCVSPDGPSSFAFHRHRSKTEREDDAAVLLGLPIILLEERRKLA